MSIYFDGQNLTDEAILTEELMKKCTFGTTAPRPIPDDLNMKDKDRFDYFTRNLQVTYPGSGPSTSMIIPNVVLHCDTFDHFGKTGVYIGTPQRWVDFVRTKLLSQGIKPVFEDPGLTSTQDHWWTRQGFRTAEEEREYIFIVEENDDGELGEIPYISFPELFKIIGTSAIANVTCAIKMTSKLPKGSKEGWTGNEEWKMGITISRVNVQDCDDIEKPRNSVTSRSVAGPKDKASSRLMAKLRAKEQKA